MRASIVVWSTVSGALLGFLVDALLVGVAAISMPLVPGLLHRRPVAIGLCLLAAVIVFGGVLGFLEGRLKAV